MDAEPGEEIFFYGHPSWRSILTFYIRGLIIAIVAGVIAGVITRVSGKSVDVRGWRPPSWSCSWP